jgi:transcriptional regulator with XRE-family HTH domain
MEPDLRSIGVTLLAVRRQLGVSQAALAERSGLGRSQLSQYESGRTCMNLTTLLRVLEELQVTPEAFFRLVNANRAAAGGKDSPSSRRREIREALVELRGAMGRVEAAILRGETH